MRRRYSCRCVCGWEDPWRVLLCLSNLPARCQSLLKQTLDRKLSIVIRESADCCLFFSAWTDGRNAHVYLFIFVGPWLWLCLAWCCHAPVYYVFVASLTDDIIIKVSNKPPARCNYGNQPPGFHTSHAFSPTRKTGKETRLSGEKGGEGGRVFSFSSRHPSRLTVCENNCKDAAFDWCDVVMCFDI